MPIAGSIAAPKCTPRRLGHLEGRETFGLLARLRADGVPVALVTGSVDVEEYRDAADAVLSKPFVPQALVAVARRLARVEV